ncbi:alkaline phosphatase family protein [Myxococcota bacterium]|nr:alkaline phosphatase family protein [Myxococcota bacterium]
MPRDAVLMGGMGLASASPAGWTQRSTIVVRWALIAGVMATVGCRTPEPPRVNGPTDVRERIEALGGVSGMPGVVVLISVAGLTSDRYASAMGQAEMPTLAAMAGVGAAADAVASVTPASTYPAHATLVTGHLPDTHGVPGDLKLGAHGVRSSPYWHTTQLQVPTLWDALSARGVAVASLAWPSTLGADVRWLVPDRIPIRRGETWLGVLGDAATAELLPLMVSHGAGEPAADSEGPARDAVLTGLACDLLASGAPPRLLLIRLTQTVAPVTREGIDSDAARDAFGAADADVAQLLECLSALGRLKDAAVVVVGDRGNAPVHTAISINALLVREGLVTLDENTGQVQEWVALARSNGGSAFVYASSDRDALHARRSFEEAAERTRAFRVVSAESMANAHADPRAWFGLEANPGYFFTDAMIPPLLSASPQRAVGGYFSTTPEMDVGFVAWGRGIRRHIRVPHMSLADVAPTLAELLGVRLEETQIPGGADPRLIEGRPLVGIFSLTPELATPQSDRTGRAEQ